MVSYSPIDDLKSTWKLMFASGGKPVLLCSEQGSSSPVCRPLLGVFRGSCTAISVGFPDEIRGTISDL